MVIGMQKTGVKNENILILGQGNSIMENKSKILKLIKNQTLKSSVIKYK